MINELFSLAFALETDFFIDSIRLYLFLICTALCFVTSYFLPKKTKKLAFVFLSVLVFLLIFPINLMYIPVLILLGSCILFRFLTSTSHNIVKIAGIVSLYALYFFLSLSNITLSSISIVFHILIHLFFIKLIYYLYEITTLGKDLASYKFIDFFIYFFFFPFLFLVHLPMSYNTFTRSLSEEREKLHQLMNNGLRLIALGLSLLAANYFMEAYLFSNQPIFDYIYLYYHLMSGYQLFMYLTLSFLVFYFWIGGSVHLLIGLLNIFGFDMYPGFQYALLSKDLLEFWRRWHIYFREFLVSTIFYPISFFFMRRGRNYTGIFIAGIVTFAGATFFHVLPLIAKQSLNTEQLLGIFISDNSVGLIVAFMLVYERAKFEKDAVRKFANGLKALTNGKFHFVWKGLCIFITLTIIILTDVFRSAVLSGYSVSTGIEVLSHLLGGV